MAREGEQTISPGEAAVSDRVLTLPNVLSVLRLIGVPVFLWAILAEHDVIALVTLMLSGVSDYLDGKIARHFGLVSRVGQLLDPLADRLYIATTLFGLAWRDVIPWWLVAVLVSREVLLAAVLAVIKRYGQTGLPVHFVGKAATFNLLYAFPLLLLGEGQSTFAEWALPVGWAFAWWGTSLYWLAGVMYIVQARQVVLSARAASVSG
ncbi:CDP-alcohol phosphatidyltransferase family protein [Knoellia sp. p5-6-4]|uniref:CDP-alcohol phosphatidyltransferase family protein n=1 Tax=unclassified Knoellia TaxID=2618719 RepID=UPI0023DBF100|nr:CDP-alcohol phosphatidyltransferase family protein [Knoellia sp. p5-6-4]MDF2146944.1 CDP-alcohol phosphatidyltransferase family protein [Knoellia sp. p5-6-4]